MSCFPQTIYCKFNILFLVNSLLPARSYQCTLLIYLARIQFTLLFFLVFTSWLWYSFSSLSFLFNYLFINELKTFKTKKIGLQKNDKPRKITEILNLGTSIYPTFSSLQTDAHNSFGSP